MRNSIFKIIKVASYIIKNIFLKIKFGSVIELHGIQGISDASNIIIDKTSCIRLKKVISRKNVHFTAVAGGQLDIGQNVFFNRNCIVICRKKISIGNNCNFGPNVVLYDHDHKFNHLGRQGGYNTGEIIIEKNCWIGASAIILRNTHIGEGCVIGAGTIVKGDIPAHSLVTSERNLKVLPLEV